MLRFSEYGSGVLMPFQPLVVGLRELLVCQPTRHTSIAIVVQRNELRQEDQRHRTSHTISFIMKNMLIVK